CPSQHFAPPDFRNGSFSSDQPAPGALGMSASLLSRPNLRTAANRRGVPQAAVSRCSKTWEDARLFDQLVGDCKQRWRHIEAKRLGGRQIDDELKLGRLHDRHLARLFALQNTAGVDAQLTILIWKAWTVAHQAADLCESSVRIDGGAPIV